MRADRHAPLAVVRPGLVPYGLAWDWQRSLVARRQSGEGHDALLLLEHPRVYTLGKRADDTHLVWSEAERSARGIELYRVDRGGDVTYHGPGQLVGYPILKLSTVRGVVDYVRALEEVLIRTLASFGIEGRRVPDFTGVWVGDRKIAAIGVRVASGGVTSHGFALNVTTDLADFTGIVPCGIADKDVCSMAALAVDATVDQVADRVEAVVAEMFAATLEHVRAEDLGLPTVERQAS